ncbi:hypothetical protein FRC12_024147 [Ceratobasidium sp. 428]|nr:hypothetical protein FRC12_024147 [Ceratobasidium sp. 428]
MRQQTELQATRCYYYAIQKGLALSKSEESRVFLFNLNRSLEAIKMTQSGHGEAMIYPNIGCLYVESFANRILEIAQENDRRGMISKSIVEKFLTAGYCFELLSVFEAANCNPNTKVDGKRMYAEQRAAEISKALRENTQPSPLLPSLPLSTFLPPPVSTFETPDASATPSVPSTLPPSSSGAWNGPFQASDPSKNTLSHSEASQPPISISQSVADKPLGAIGRSESLAVPPRRVHFSDSVRGGESQPTDGSRNTIPLGLPPRSVHFSSSTYGDSNSAGTSFGPIDDNYNSASSSGFHNIDVPITTVSSATRRIPFNSSTFDVAHTTENGPLVELASSSMSVQEMFDCLLQHGCSDFSTQIDFIRDDSIAIAGGGFGDIYRWELRDGTPVAIKTLRHHALLQDTAPKALKRAMRELYTWSKAKHKNVQELLGVMIFKGQLGMVSPWMDNGNLEEYIRKNPGVNRLDLVAHGVAYLHSIDMVHGDLKSRNVLVDKDGVARLSDFDHSILSNCTLLFTETSNSGGGTLRWMAPELLLSEDDAALSSRSKQTDIYALGMTMLEIATGRVPYAEYKVDSSIIRALDKKEFPTRPKETISDAMWALFTACWDHDPEARPSASRVYLGIITQ